MHVFPKRALTIQKRHMQRFLRKPRDTPIKDFIARVVEMNEYLKLFPPFGQDQALLNDELLDLAEFATPSSWQRLMVVQGFNPMEHSLQEFVEFCQRMEYTEAHDAKTWGEAQNRVKDRPRCTKARKVLRARSQQQETSCKRQVVSLPPD